MNPRKISALFMICTMGLTSTLTAQAVSDPTPHDARERRRRLALCRGGNWDLLGTGPNAPVLGLAHSDGCGVRLELTTFGPESRRLCGTR